jgi:uncharacterized membrane protein (DUF106 family)
MPIFSEEDRVFMKALQSRVRELNKTLKEARIRGMKTDVSILSEYHMETRVPDQIIQVTAGFEETFR